MRDLLQISAGYLLLLTGIAAFGVLAVAAVAIATVAIIVGLILIPLYEGTDWIKWRLHSLPSLTRPGHH